MRIKQIAEDYNIKVINVTANKLKRYAKIYGMTKKDFKNNAYVIGDDEIILGIYDDKELRMAAFFHEIGHTLISRNYLRLTNYDLMLTEYQAWIEGLKVAKKYGYKFSDKTYKYILQSVNSYYKEALSLYNEEQKIKN